MTTHFLVHDAIDSVGVITVEEIQAGQELNGWVMETDATLQITTLDPIPLGHKIALKDLAENETILKYGHDIGKIVKAVKRGGHVHVHNAKTKRW